MRTSISPSPDLLHRQFQIDPLRAPQHCGLDRFSHLMLLQQIADQLDQLLINVSASDRLRPAVTGVAGSATLIGQDGSISPNRITVLSIGRVADLWCRGVIYKCDVYDTYLCDAKHVPYSI